MGRGLGMEQNWPLVYLKSLMFNPCTSRILWRGRTNAPQSAGSCTLQCFLFLPWICCQSPGVPWLWCLLALESAPPCYWQCLLFGPHIYLPGTCSTSLFCPLARPAPSQLPPGGKAPTYKPQMDQV